MHQFLALLTGSTLKHIIWQINGNIVYTQKDYTSRIVEFESFPYNFPRFPENFAGGESYTKVPTIFQCLSVDLRRST